LGIELERPGHMVRIIAGVEMGDDDLAELLLECRAEMVARLAQLREGVALVPGEAGAARLAAAAVLVGEDAAVGAFVDVRRQRLDRRRGPSPGVVSSPSALPSPIGQLALASAPVFVFLRAVASNCNHRLRARRGSAGRRVTEQRRPTLLQEVVNRRVMLGAD